MCMLRQLKYCIVNYFYYQFQIGLDDDDGDDGRSQCIFLLPAGFEELDKALLSDRGVDIQVVVFVPDFFEQLLRLLVILWVFLVRHCLVNVLLLLHSRTAEEVVLDLFGLDLAIQ